MVLTHIWHWAFFWIGLFAQVPFLWYLARLSFPIQRSCATPLLHKYKLPAAVAGGIACCLFAQLEQDQLLFWGQTAAIMCYIKLAQHIKKHE